MDKIRRVVVTGLGAVTPIGNDVNTFWQNLLDGVCGIDMITSFPTDDMPVKIAGEVKDFNPADYEIETPFARKQDRFTLFAVSAAWQAVKEAGMTLLYHNHDFEFVKISGIYGLDFIYQAIDACTLKTESRQRTEKGTVQHLVNVRIIPIHTCRYLLQPRLNDCLQAFLKAFGNHATTNLDGGSCKGIVNL